MVLVVADSGDDVCVCAREIWPILHLGDEDLVKIPFLVNRTWMDWAKSKPQIIVGEQMLSNRTKSSIRLLMHQLLLVAPESTALRVEYTKAIKALCDKLAQIINDQVRLLLLLLLWRANTDANC